MELTIHVCLELERDFFRDQSLIFVSTAYLGSMGSKNAKIEMGDAGTIENWKFIKGFIKGKIMILTLFWSYLENETS